LFSAQNQGLRLDFTEDLKKKKHVEKLQLGALHANFFNLQFGTCFLLVSSASL
jgi:hypothetical protein